jgi:hypothetical protein
VTKYLPAPPKNDKLSLFLNNMGFHLLCLKQWKERERMEWRGRINKGIQISHSREFLHGENL